MHASIGVAVTALGLLVIETSPALSADGSQEVTIPLQGVLALRCEARIVSSRVAVSANMIVDAQVQHRCNAEHILTVSHRELPGQRAGDVTISYNGSPPASTTPTSANFRYGPVSDGTRPLRVSFKLRARGANPDELGQAIRVEVAPR